MKANNKTQPSETSTSEYINTIADPDRKRDAEILHELIQQSTHSEPKMWGTSIIGYGTHHYMYDSGREGDIAAIGFSARKQALAVYGLRTEQNAALLEEMSLAHESKGCVYIKNIQQIDKTLLQEAIINAYRDRNN